MKHTKNNFKVIWFKFIKNSALMFAVVSVLNVVFGNSELPYWGIFAVSLGWCGMMALIDTVRTEVMECEATDLVNTNKIGRSDYPYEDE